MPAARLARQLGKLILISSLRGEIPSPLAPKKRGLSGLTFHHRASRRCKERRQSAVSRNFVFPRHLNGYQTAAPARARDRAIHAATGRDSATRAAQGSDDPQRPTAKRGARVVTAALAVSLGAAGLVAAGLGAASGCDDGPPAPPKTAGATDPPPTQRLHPPGELRLTSAGTPPRIRLRYRLEAGQRQGYRTWLKASHEAAGQTSRLVARFDWERAVEQVQGEQAQVKVRVRRVRRVRPTSIRDRVKPWLQGLSLRHRLDSRGRVAALEPPRTLGALGGAGALARFSAPLPEDAVGQGARWERSESWPVHLPKSQQQVRIGVRTGYRLSLESARGKAPRTATLEMSVRLTASPMDPEALTGQQVRGGGQGRGTLKLDLQKGRVERSRSTLKLSLTVIGYGRRQSLTQRLETRTRAIRLPRAR